MKNITQYFGITRAVPFVDVAVARDNLLFIDPHAIRLSRTPGPFAGEAIDCIDSYFDTIARCVMSPSVSDRMRGRALLNHFPEPKETRFGMSVNGFHGHGGAADVGRWIWNGLSTDLHALLRVGVLKRLGELPLYIDGVGDDITSDITTRIIYGPLARYTAEMVRRYPEFSSHGHKLVTIRSQAWDPSTREWVVAAFTLPVAHGEPLLLVPTSWARSGMLMSARRFYETSVLTYVQDEQAVLNSRGKLLKSPKYRLRTLPGLEPGRRTNLKVTLRALESSDDVLDLFRKFVAMRAALQERDAG